MIIGIIIGILVGVLITLIFVIHFDTGMISYILDSRIDNEIKFGKALDMLINLQKKFLKEKGVLNKDKQ